MNKSLLSRLLQAGFSELILLWLMINGNEINDLSKERRAEILNHTPASLSSKNSAVRRGLCGVDYSATEK